MGIALGVRRVLTYVRCPSRWPAHCCPLPYVLQPRPTFDRSPFSSLQRAKPGAEADNVEVPKTGGEDRRERVVILGSGWAGMKFSLPLQTGAEAEAIIAPRSTGPFLPCVECKSFFFSVDRLMKT